MSIAFPHETDKNLAGCGQFDDAGWRRYVGGLMR